MPPCGECSAHWAWSGDRHPHCASATIHPLAQLPFPGDLSQPSVWSLSSLWLRFPSQLLTAPGAGPTKGAAAQKSHPSSSLRLASSVPNPPGMWYLPALFSINSVLETQQDFQVGWPHGHHHGRHREGTQPDSKQPALPKSQSSAGCRVSLKQHKLHSDHR